MNNIKKIALGLLIAAFAFGFSAFTNQAPIKKAPRAAGAMLVTGDFIVQSATNVFRDYTLPTPPNTTNCLGSAAKDCVYEVTMLGKANIPAEPGGGYTDTQIQDYLDDNWLQPADNSNPALYTGAYQ